MQITNLHAGVSILSCHFDFTARLRVCKMIHFWKSFSILFMHRF